MQIDMATLEDRTDADSKLLSAVLALLEAITLLALGVLLRRLGANAIQFIGVAHHAAARTNWTVRP